MKHWSGDTAEGRWQVDILCPPKKYGIDPSLMPQCLWPSTLDRDRNAHFLVVYIRMYPFLHLRAGLQRCFNIANHISMRILANFATISHLACIATFPHRSGQKVKMFNSRQSTFFHPLRNKLVKPHNPQETAGSGRSREAKGAAPHEVHPYGPACCPLSRSGS